MEKLKNLKEIEDFIKDNKLSLVFFSSPGCNVCTVLYEKVSDMLRNYPDIKAGKVDISEVVEAQGKYSVFTIPTVLLYIEGSETIRESRYISMDDLHEKIRRYYQLYIEQ